MLRALLLEDSPRDVEIIRELLIDAGFDLNMDCAALETEFVSLLRSRMYDIILADFKLSGFDAFAALQWAMGICPQVPFVCVSGSIGEEAAVDLLKQGAVDYVLKDRLTKLPSAINRALEEVKEKDSRRQAEKALLESEHRFQTLAEMSPVGIFQTDAEGSTTYVNPRWCQISGVSKEEAIGTGWISSVHSEDKEKLSNGWKKATQALDSSQAEYRFVHKDGTIAWVMGQAVPERNSENKIVGYIGTITDITERKRAEEALRERERKLNTLFEILPVGISILDSSRNITYVNPALEKMVGLSKQDLGKKVYENRKYLNSAGAPMPADEFASMQVLKEGKAIQNVEIGVVKEDGSVVWTNVSAVPVDFPDWKIVVVSSDITERKRAEAALRTSQAQLSNAMKMAHLGHWEYDVADDLFTFNDHFYAMFRTTVGQVGGYTMSSAQYAQRFVHPDDLPLVGVEIRKSLETADPHYSCQMEHRIIYADGEIGYITVRILIVKDEQGRTIKTYGVNQDITERKRAEETLRELSTRQEAILSAVPDIVVEVDANKTYTWANQAGREFFGDDVIGKEANLFFEGKQDTYDVVQPLFKGAEDVIYVESWQRRKDGEKRLLAWWCRVLKDRSGHVTGVLSTARDVTERKRAEEAVRESEERFRMVFENVFDGISIYSEDPDPSKRRLVECNERYATMAGRSREELLRLGSTQALQRTLDEKTNNSRLESLAGGTAYQGSFSWIRPDQKNNFVEYIDVPIIWRGKPHSIGINRDVTERKRAEAALRTSQAQLFSAMKMVHLGHWEYDVASDLFTFNDHFYAMFRTTVGQVGGYTMSSAQYVQRFVHPDDLPLVGVEIRKSLETADPHYSHQMEHRIIYADGEIGYITVRILIIKDEQGRTIKTYGVNQDITERKVAEEALTYERNLLKALMDNMPDHLYFKDKDCRFLRISRSLANAFDLDDPAQAAGKTDFDFFAEEHARPAFEDEQLVMKSGIAKVGLEEKESWPDGRQTWVSTTKVPLQDAQGEIIGTFGISRDITNRKLAEEALKQSEEKYRRLFEESKDAVYISSADGKILDINAAGLEMLGYGSKEEIRTLRIDQDIFVDAERSHEFQRHLSKQGFVKDFRAEFKRKDGRPIQIIETASAVRDDAGSIIGNRGIIRDVTSQRQLEQELIQAQKMESIGTLASGIAHDFNNILGIILGYTSLIERTAENSRSLAESLQAVKDAVDRGAGLVKQILTFARKTKIVFGPIDPNLMIKEMAKLLRETFPKSTVLSTELTVGHPLILADPTQVHQAILNLCVNARDAMAEHGTLTLATEIVSGSSLRSLFPNVADQDYICLSVADTGVGMDEATRVKIFDPFFTTKERGKGTGLGLSVVYGVMKNHNGFVNVQSEPGKGATFNLYFPLTQQHAQVAQELSEKWENIQGGHETILLVEDEVSILEIIKTMLEMKGYQIITGRDGKEALDLFVKHRDQIALVLTDLGLPRLNGIELFHELKRIDPKVRVILASGYIDPQVKSETLKAGVLEFIQKPYTPSDVLHKLRRVLDGSRSSQ